MKNRFSQGFSLIEVLIALVILSITLTSFALTFSSIVNSLLYLQDKTAANWVALNVIAKAQMGLIDLRNSSSSTAPMLGRLWTWQATTATTPDPAISRMTVEVRKSENSSALIHVTAYLGKASL